MNKIKYFAAFIALSIVLSINAEVLTGNCGLNGDNLTYSLDTESGVLKIEGSGHMAIYGYSSYAPWYSISNIITKIELPEELMSIGTYAFSNCISLTCIEIPNSVQKIGCSAFSGCTSITSVNLPLYLKKIESRSFEECTNLASITIPKNVSNIDSYAFSGCTNLASVTISSYATSIDSYAFQNCERLTEMTINALTPPYVFNSIFSNIDINKTTIYVPTQSIDIYKSTEPWNSFGVIRYIENEDTNAEKGINYDINDDGKVDICDVSSLIFKLTCKKDKDNNSILLPGEFSVSNSKKVRFTTGNLYWDGMEFCIEKEQIDYPTTWSAFHVGHFYWTTSASKSYNNGYDSINRTNSKLFFADGSDKDHTLTINNISGLYSLPTEEWNYLLYNRDNAFAYMKEKVTVENIEGCIIIAPDNFSETLKNSYSLDEINEKGLLCLVPAGQRYNSDIFDMDTGRYLSSTLYTDYSEDAGKVQFGKNQLIGLKHGMNYRCYGSSIRLATDCNNFIKYDFNNDVKQDNEDVNALANYILTNDLEQEESHEYVDLGLNVKWATMNVGAVSPEDYGLFFAWGATTGYACDTSDGHSFDWSNAPFNGGNSNYSSTFWKESKNTIVDLNNNLLPIYDTAYCIWGGLWRMPTYAEMAELINKCTWVWTNQNGTNGYKVTGTNGNSIFLPACGYRYDTELEDVEDYGSYWSSSANKDYPNNAYYLKFDNSDYDMHNYVRYCGRNVRAVYP